MRGIRSGRDLGPISTAEPTHHDVPTRRAASIVIMAEALRRYPDDRLRWIGGPRGLRDRAESDAPRGSDSGGRAKPPVPRTPYELRWCSRSPELGGLIRVGPGFLYEGAHDPAYADVDQDHLRICGPDGSSAGSRCRKCAVQSTEAA